MNTKAVRMLAKALVADKVVQKNGEPLTFDMKNWCGSACCIAGWANILLADDETDQNVEHDLFSAERKLGLSRDQALALFSPALNIPYRDVTPQQAAAVLERLAESNVVDWGELKKPPIASCIPERMSTRPKSRA